MAWDAYYVYGGSEVLNGERVETYAKHAGLPWFYPTYRTTAISHLDNVSYNDPVTDEAPWVDPDNPATKDFWGAYPLNVVGIENSSRTAAVTENTGDGAHVGPPRHGSKEIVFSAALLGASMAAVDAGFKWLKATLNPGPCTNGDCEGADLCYLAYEPCVTGQCDHGDTDCTDAAMRTMRKVTFTNGPTVTGKQEMSDGSHVWQVSFTATAANPYEFGNETVLVEGFPLVPDPWVPAVVPADWAFQNNPTDHEDVDCAESIYNPIVDPLCPAIEVPPGVPSIPLGCYQAPTNWRRRWFTIPRKYIPYWSDAVPIVSIQARSTAVRGLRLRFYADLNADASVLDDPCAYCGDILFSYIPPNHTIVFDGAAQQVYAEGPGGQLRRADSLVFKTDGTPFDWPLLTCGYGYVVALDWPVGNAGNPPAVDLSIVPRSSD